MPTRARSGLASAFAALAVALCSAVPASAATTTASPVGRSADTPTTQGATAVTSAQAGSTANTPQASSSKISCVLSIANPHRSTHNPTQVNVVAKWKCTANVRSLSMTVALYSFAGFQLSSNPFSNSGKDRLRGSTDAFCIPDYYYGTASGTVVYPKGYKPASAHLKVRSATKFVLCI